jgi:AcrR family transcriptional regulator
VKARGVTEPGRARQAGRLPAAERREAVLDAALRVFSSGSYAGTTIAEIAQEAGVTEPVIYRHFESKRDLWFACMDEAWQRFRAAHEAKLAELGEEQGVAALGATVERMKRSRVLLANLWIQAVAEAAEDTEIQRYVRRHMRAAHAHIAAGLGRTQACGGIPADRDPDAEAWIMIAGSLLISFADRLGGVLSEKDFAAIKRERLRWLLGREPD